MTAASRALRTKALLAGLVAGTLFVSACSGRSAESTPSSGAADVGITDTDVAIGATFPLSGPASVYGATSKAASALFDKVNADGGAPFGDGKKRQIKYTALDGQLDPARDVSNNQALVQKYKVFATWGQWSADSLGSRDYLNNEGVPQVLLNSPLSELNADYATYPFTMSFAPSLKVEAAVMVQSILGAQPNATIALLYMNNAAGVELKGDVEQAVKGTGASLVASQSIQVTATTPDSQITNLAASGATAFINYATSNLAAQAIAAAKSKGWDPYQILATSSNSIKDTLTPAGLDNSTGIYSSFYLRDPADPAWADDPDMKAYRDLMSANGIDPDNFLALTGYAEAQVLLDIFSKMKTPTRADFMSTLRSLDLELGVLLPGVNLQSSANDPYLIQSLGISQFDGTRWVSQGDAISVKIENP